MSMSTLPYPLTLWRTLGHIWSINVPLEKSKKLIVFSVFLCFTFYFCILSVYKTSHIAKIRMLSTIFIRTNLFFRKITKNSDFWRVLKNRKFNFIAFYAWTIFFHIRLFWSVFSCWVRLYYSFYRNFKDYGVI